MSETLSKYYFEREMGEDKISNLPDDIIDRIFSYLPIKDTGKTSLLSRKWRYKWEIVSSLVFDDDSVPSYNLEQQALTTRKFMSYIDRILLLHSGLICKFCIRYDAQLPVEDIENWILHISRHPIKEFTFRLIGSENFKMLSCFFSCQTLTHLDLHFCSLNPPLTFKGFKALKSLTLRYVSLSDDALAILVSSCKLEKLTLVNLFGVDHFNINAPNLHCLDFHGTRYEPSRITPYQLNVNAPNLQRLYFNGPISKLSLKSTPRLSEFSITILPEEHPRKSNNLLKLFSNITQLEKLTIYSFFEPLDFGFIPRALRTPLLSLHFLSIIIDFSSLKWTSLLLFLLRSAPNLQEVVISCAKDVINELSEDVWQAGEGNCIFTRLRHVRITNFRGFIEEINFISFMLLSSPVLVELTVEPDIIYWNNTNDEWKNYLYYDELRQRLLSFIHASPNMEIVFKYR